MQAVKHVERFEVDVDYRTLALQLTKLAKASKGMTARMRLVA